MVRNEPLGDIVAAASRVFEFDGGFEPTGIYLAHFGPALECVLGSRGNRIVFGPNSPMAKKDLAAIFGGLGLDIEDHPGFAAALDALAAAVVPAPTSDENAVDYIDRLNANYALVYDLLAKGEAAMGFAPWTDEEVANLEAWQRSSRVHPYTCGRCRDADTGERPLRDDHLLVPTVDGWRCPTCDCRQDWCYGPMLAGPPPWPFGAAH